LLRNLKERRILEEARRVFYVAVTRARRGLVMSAVIKQATKGNLVPPAASPLGWLWQYYRPEALSPGTAVVWPEPDLRAELVSQVPALTPAAPETRELPPALDFQPEALPYQLEFPSQLVEKPAGLAPFPGSGGDDIPRLRGEITHRLMQTLGKGGALPPPAAVATALRQEGVATEPAARLAPKILTEVAACRRDPFLAGLLDAEVPPASEWLLEEHAGPGLIRRGQIDLLAFDGKDWWLLDYKTSRPEPEEAWEEFIAREVEKYRPQLLAYRQMAARFKNIAPESLHLALYFTACRRAVEI